MELSKQRAYKVQRWLSMMGISPFRIDVEYYGSQQPMVKEGSPLNRRVEMFIKCN
jgi:outer membrane protein OmpA-like peptidoglycan-associated protein